jgi:hypothetical protein
VGKIELFLVIYKENLRIKLRNMRDMDKTVAPPPPHTHTHKSNSIKEN